MRNPTDGVALAAIVARETVNKNWNGTGGGIGFGPGGLGLMVGGVVGTSFEKTDRARALGLKSPGGYSPLRVMAPLLAGPVALGLMSFILQMVVNALSFDDGAMPSWVHYVPRIEQVVAIIWLFVAGIQMMLGRRQAEEQARSYLEERFHEKKKAVYQRLRYVEADHIVFDPKTGREVPADQHAIASLLDSLSGSPQPQAPAPRAA